jgi:hypothetical protein
MTPENALKWATLFHETYEANAPRFGYETRLETRRFDPDSDNGKLMLLVCSKVVEVAQAENPALRERAEKAEAACLEWRRIVADVVNSAASSGMYTGVLVKDDAYLRLCTFYAQSITHDQPSSTGVRESLNEGGEGAPHAK